MYAAVKSNSDDRKVHIKVATSANGFTKFKNVMLPEEFIENHSFTVMDASENQVFLYIKNHGEETPVGDIFISDGSGQKFSLSLENVVKTDQLVDFEKIESLDGVYIANRYDVEHSHIEYGVKKGIKGSATATQQIDSEDIEDEEENLGRMSRN